MRELLIVVLVGSTLSAPQSFQDMMDSLSGMNQRIHRVPSVLSDFRDHFGSRMSSFGNDFGDEFANLGRQVDAMSNHVERGLHNQLDKVPDMWGNLGDKVPEIWDNLEDKVPEMWDNLEDKFGDLGMNVARQFDSFGDSLGGHLGNFGNWGNSQVDRMWAKPKPWYQGNNVCVEKKLLDEEDEQSSNIKITMTPKVNFHMQMSQCLEGADFYECSNTISDAGSIKTLKVRYTCCHGYSLIDREMCTKVSLSSLNDTVTELGGEMFLEMLVEHQMVESLNNVTLFVPDEEAMEDWRVELEQVADWTPGETTIYSVDDGLLSYRRKKRGIMIIEQPSVEDILADHIIEGFVNTRDLPTNGLVTTSGGSKVRVTSYKTSPETTLMFNCAKVTSRDNEATNGVVNMIDRVILPASDTIGNILSSDQQFTNFVSALTEHNLMDMISNKDGITVFAPSDVAYNKLTTLDKMVSGSSCARDILLTHILPSVLCSGVVEANIKIRNMLGRDLELSQDQDSNVMVGNIKLVIKDKMATNGVIHVIEDLIIHDSVKTIIDHLKDKKADKLLNLLEKSGLDKTLENMSNITFFAPSEQAVSEIPTALHDELIKDPKKLENLLLHHVTLAKKGPCDLTNNQELETAGGHQVMVNLHRHFGHRQSLATVQCARIIDTDGQVCGGHLHVIDRVLTPPTGDLMEMIARDHKQFAKLVDFAGIPDELSTGHHTVFVPIDSSFDKLDDDISSKIFSDKEMAASVVRNHILPDSVCCASVPRISGFLQMQLARRSRLGHNISLRRSNGGHVFANKVAVTRCDIAASNGVLHSIEGLLLPPHMDKTRQTRKQTFWMF